LKSPVKRAWLSGITWHTSRHYAASWTMPRVGVRAMIGGRLGSPLAV
jgi:hypothetical protein